MSGWIKMHRQALETPELRRGDAKGVWLVLLLRAAHKPTRVVWGNKPVHIGRGQLAISVRKLAREEGIGNKRLRAILDIFKNADMIKMDTVQGAAFTLITICNYDAFQRSGDGKDTASDTARKQLGHTEQEREEGKESYTPPPSAVPPKGGNGLAVVSSKDSSRGTRIPDDWRPPDEGVAYAVELLGADLANETWVTFRDYWRAKAGASARKVSWPLTWKTWVRREHERLVERQAREQRWAKRA